MRPILLSILLAMCSYGQTTSGPATTSGPCSPAVPGSNNRFQINCPGMSMEQFNQLVGILNRIARDRLDPKAVMAKLDEISAGVEELQKRVGDRMLTEPQASALMRTLRQSPGSLRVVILGDREANAYGRALINVLAGAGWKVIVDSIGMQVPPRYGIQVRGSDALLKAFVAAGISVSETSEMPGIPPGPAVLVGLKPY